MLCISMGRLDDPSVVNSGTDAPGPEPRRDDGPGEHEDRPEGGMVIGNGERGNVDFPRSRSKDRCGR